MNSQQKKEKLMPQSLEKCPNCKDGTEASTGEKSVRSFKLDSGRGQKIIQVSCKVGPRLIARIRAVDLV